MESNQDEKGIDVPVELDNPQVMDRDDPIVAVPPIAVNVIVASSGEYD